jgi:hypothetical protein
MTVNKDVDRIMISTPELTLRLAMFSVRGRVRVMVCPVHFHSGLSVMLGIDT